LETVAKRFKSPRGIEIGVIIDYDNDVVKWDNEVDGDDLIDPPLLDRPIGKISKFEEMIKSEKWEEI
jgi:hypothetical protein